MLALSNKETLMFQGEKDHLRKGKVLTNVWFNTDIAAWFFFLLTLDRELLGLSENGFRKLF